MKVKKIQTAAFYGHKKLPQDISKLRAAVEGAVINLINRGAICFGAGGAPGFDALASKVVLNLRDTLYPQIRLVQVLPFRGVELGWSSEQKNEFYEIIGKSDRIVWFADEYAGDELYQARDRYLVNHAAHLIFYCTGVNGESDAASCYRYAVTKGINLISLAEQSEPNTF